MTKMSVKIVSPRFQSPLLLLSVQYFTAYKRLNELTSRQANDAVFNRQPSAQSRDQSTTMQELQSVSASRFVLPAVPYVKNADTSARGCHPASFFPSRCFPSIPGRPEDARDHTLEGLQRGFGEARKTASVFDIGRKEISIR